MKAINAAHFLAEWQNASPTLDIRTSGSTGTPKTIAVSKEMMRRSARKTLRFFDLKAGDTALLCLPADYIAGKMMVVRAIEGNLTLYAVEPSAAPLQHFPLPEVDFAAMTPMQVFEELKNGGSLHRVRKLLIGGSAVSRALDDALQNCSCQACESYGMTETVSHIALRRINGKERQEGFMPLDGVSVSLDGRGCLVIDCPDLLAAPLPTSDRADLLPSGGFRILGRVDNVLNSGGIKIQPEEIEKRIEAFFTQAFAVSALPDEKLGDRLVLVSEENISSEKQEEINLLLPKYQRLHRFFCLPEIPKTLNGKLDRPAIRSFLSSLSGK